jgi:hypothetical protein
MARRSPSPLPFATCLDRGVHSERVLPRAVRTRSARARVWWIPALALLCASVALVFPGGGRASDLDARETMRVLFVGNSYTRFNDLPRMVGELSRSTPAGPRLQTSRETQGGYDLRRHWNRRRVRQRIERGRFDAVVIQGHSLAPIRQQDRTSEYARRFSQHVQASGARMILFQTWARHPRSRVYRRYGLRGPGEMLDRIDAFYRDISRELSVPVAPVGRAWQRAADELPDASLHRRDGTHPALAGSYLSACVVYGTLTGRDPRQATWHPWRMPPAQAARIRAIAAQSLAPR